MVRRGCGTHLPARGARLNGLHLAKINLGDCHCSGLGNARTWRHSLLEIVTVSRAAFGADSWHYRLHNIESP